MSQRRKFIEILAQVSGPSIREIFVAFRKSMCLFNLLYAEKSRLKVWRLESFFKPSLNVFRPLSSKLE